MIHIAICDDDDRSNQKLHAWIETCFQEKGIPFQGHVFNSSKALWYEIDDGTYFDIILLDIEMPQLNGMELAKRIRSVLPDVVIIFLSSYEKYMVDVFELNAFRFIPKDQMEKRLAPALLNAVDKIEFEKNRYYVVENKREIEKIPLKQIVKIWREGKNSIILKSNGTISQTRKTLATVYAALSQEDFIWINRGMICNLAHIMSVDGEHAVLTDRSEVPVIRGNIIELKAKVRNYWIEKEGLK